MDAYVYHQNDRLFELWFYLTQNTPVMQLDGTYKLQQVVIDVSAATTVVTAKFRLAGDDSTLQEVICTNVFDGSDGCVLFEWPEDSLDVDPSLYEIQVSIDFNGKKVTAIKYFPITDLSDDCNRLPILVREEYADA